MFNTSKGSCLGLKNTDNKNQDNFKMCHLLKLYFGKKLLFFCGFGWNGIGDMAKPLFKGLRNEIRFSFS